MSSNEASLLDRIRVLEAENAALLRAAATPSQTAGPSFAHQDLPEDAAGQPQKQEQQQQQEQQDHQAATVFGEGQLTKAEVERYSRQVMLPQIGSVGTQRLLSSRVLIVGCGGLCSSAALYLAAAGVGHLTLVDFDVVDRSNLHRQIIHMDSECGNPKVFSAAKQCRALNPTIEVRAIRQRFTAENALELALAHDVVMDATDNVAARYLVNDACVLAKKPLVSGSAMRFEGQLTVYHYDKEGFSIAGLSTSRLSAEEIPNAEEKKTAEQQRGAQTSSKRARDATSAEAHASTVEPSAMVNGELSTDELNRRRRCGPCYRCMFPDPPPLSTLGSCNESGVLGVVPGAIGCLQALEVQKIILGASDGVMAGRMLFFDAMAGTYRVIRARPRQSGCRICGDEPSITALSDLDAAYAGCGAAPVTELPTVNRTTPRAFIDACLDTSNAMSTTPSDGQRAPAKPSDVDDSTSSSDEVKKTEAPLVLDVRVADQFHMAAAPKSAHCPLPALEKLVSPTPTAPGLAPPMSAEVAMSVLAATAESIASHLRRQTTESNSTVNSTDHGADNDEDEKTDEKKKKKQHERKCSDIFVVCRRGRASATATKLLLDAWAVVDSTSPSVDAAVSSIAAAVAAKKLQGVQSDTESESCFTQDRSIARQAATCLVAACRGGDGARLLNVDGGLNAVTACGGDFPEY